MKLPGIEERHPVDVVPQNGEIDIIENTVTGEAGAGGVYVDQSISCLRWRDMCQRQLRRQAFLVRVLLAPTCIVLARLLDNLSPAYPARPAPAQHQLSATHP